MACEVPNPDRARDRLIKSNFSRVPAFFPQPLCDRRKIPTNRGNLLVDPRQQVHVFEQPVLYPQRTCTRLAKLGPYRLSRRHSQSGLIRCHMTHSMLILHPPLFCLLSCARVTRSPYDPPLRSSSRLSAFPLWTWDAYATCRVTAEPSTLQPLLFHSTKSRYYTHRITPHLNKRIL